MKRIACVLCITVFLFGCSIEIPEEPQSNSGVSFEPVTNTPATTTTEAVMSDFASVDAALSALVTASADGDKKQQVAAHSWLCKQGPSAIQPVLTTMNDESVNITARRHACSVLGHLGPDAASHLVAATESDSLALKLRAIESLPRIEPMQDSAVQRLIVLLDDSNDQVRHTAIRSLGHIGTPARAAADKLNAMRDNVNLSETTRLEAGKSLKLVRPIRTFDD